MGKLTDLWRRKSEQAEGTNVATAPGAAGAVLRAGPPAEAEVRPPANTTWAERRRYLDEEVIADATTCHVENRDVGICTRGNGSAAPTPSQGLRTARTSYSTWHAITALGGRTTTRSLLS
jgi:hypothetical protein